MHEPEAYLGEGQKGSVENIKKDLWEDLKNKDLLPQFPYKLTSVVDEVVRKIFNKVYYSNTDFRKIPCAIIAVGGYGRGELYWHSDLDLLIIYEDFIPTIGNQIAKLVFTPLWDMGFDLGHGVRTVDDCINLALKDTKTFTSLLDMRFIAGNSGIFQALLNTFEALLVRNKTEYIAQLTQIFHERSKEHSLPQDMLEPNLKEGIGGLRDYHHILWLRKTLFGFSHTPTNLNTISAEDFFSEIREHTDYIGVIRNLLHQLYKRKNDILRMDLQHKLGNAIFCNTTWNSVGEFLGELYGHMSNLRFLAESISATMIDRSVISDDNRNNKLLHSGVIEIKQDDFSLESFLNSVFIAARDKKQLSIDSIQFMKKMNKSLFAHRDSINYVFEYLDKMITERYSYSMITLLLHLGILDYIMPEFSLIKNMVQYDTYHIHPVGRHSVETLKFLCEIDKYGNIFEQTLMYEIKNKKPLFWAALLHDIGKGSKSHEILGSEKAEELLRRGKIHDTTIEETSFLIKHHLLMAETAQRKNLNEEKTIVECARTIGTPERAKMLYLLTWVDSRSTGPKAWDSWVEYLVQELLIKVLHVFERGNLASKDVAATSRQNITLARQILSEIIPEEKFSEFFQGMGIRYSLENSPWEIKAHVEMAMELKALKRNNRQNFIINWKDYTTDGIIEFTIVTIDHPGLFSKISGVLSLNGFNILAARAYTWANRIAVDVIELTYPPDPLRLQEKFQKVEMDLSEALQGTLDIKHMLSRKSGVIKRDHPSYRPRKVSEVIIDNAQSDFFTVIQVYTTDKIGLLYDITSVLYEHNLDIKFAKIGSKGDMVADFFYVKDTLGQKLLDEEKINQLKNALLKAIE